MQYTRWLINAVFIISLATFYIGSSAEAAEFVVIIPEDGKTVEYPINAGDVVIFTESDAELSYESKSNSLIVTYQKTYHQSHKIVKGQILFNYQDIYKQHKPWQITTTEYLSRPME